MGTNQAKGLLLEKFLIQFEEYCITPGIDSGKARSYAKAVEYLCDYLKISVINEETTLMIRNIEHNVYDKNSKTYQELLSFLSSRGQKSYLTKGFIKAALKYFFNFV